MNSTGNPCRKSALCLTLQHVMLATQPSLPSKGERLAHSRSFFQILFCLHFNGVWNLEKWSSAGRKCIHKTVMSRNQNMHFVLFVKWPSEVMKTGLCTLHCSVVQSLTFPDFHSKIPLFLLHIVSHFLIKLAYFRIFEIVWSLCMVCLHALNPCYNDVVQFKIFTILW